MEIVKETKLVLMVGKEDFEQYFLERDVMDANQCIEQMIIRPGIKAAYFSISGRKELKEMNVGDLSNFVSHLKKDEVLDEKQYLETVLFDRDKNKLFLTMKVVVTEPKKIKVTRPELVLQE